MLENNYILAINPGSTTTKIAVSVGNNQVFLKTIKHDAETLAKFEKIADQFQFRRDLVLNEVKENGIPFDKIEKAETGTSPFDLERRG